MTVIAYCGYVTEEKTMIYGFKGGVQQIEQLTNTMMDIVYEEETTVTNATYN